MGHHHDTTSTTVLRLEKQICSPTVYGYHVVRVAKRDFCYPILGKFFIIRVFIVRVVRPS